MRSPLIIISITVALLLVSAGIGYAMLRNSSTTEPPPQNTSPADTPTPTQYALTINTVGNGTTTGAGTYDEGTVVPITATPASGWQFDNWTGDVANPNSATATVTMDADKTVTANFSEAPPAPTPPDELPVSNFEQEMEKLTETITNVAATGESSEVSLVFSEEAVNDQVAQALVGTTIDAGMTMEVTAVNLDLQTGTLIVAEIKGKTFGLGITIRVTAQISIQAGKPVVEIIDANVSKDLVAGAITQALDNLLTQLTRTGTADDEKVDIEFTDITIQDDKLTLVVMVRPEA